ncbi:hypothetical protein WQE_23533 [Paraburkholderia hospita]|uniref:DUF3293 domain-containing protein n=1 Tax=Paraburkholderia hospita TaxID=169430 RepID=A0ABN0FIL3_9BURK|nr:DUF3293 domain-containing protein [Paraburkholderia hospita]EIM98553.1 hypothetical protein WQE_23533 [Paraburkholderia hospita]OUL86622.1 hypothetical protein CA602_15430 [Paraburkholderia hospita]
MFSDTVIPRETIQAYLETHYHLYGSTPTTLKIGRHNPTLAELQAKQHVITSAFITACNPFSQSLDPSANARRNEALARDIERHGATCIDGIGAHPSNEWPGEPSFLGLGLTLDEARKLGAEHGQNAIVWCGEDAIPQLVLLR